MAIAKADKRELDQAHSDYGEKHGGRKEDYFACIYLAKKFKCRVEDIARQCAFGNNDYGIDAYYVDRLTQNLYLFQFKWSENPNLFKESLDRLAKDGMERIFGNALADPKQNDLLINLRADLDESKFLIKEVRVQMVFMGDLDPAEKNEGLQSRRENLENKTHLVQGYFNNPEIALRVEFIAVDSRPAPLKPSQDTFQMAFTNTTSITTTTPDGQKTMYVGFLPLMDLWRVHRSLGQKFLSRNIRSGLSPNNPPNKKIRESLSNIVIHQTLTPDVFPFNHNGVTLAAEHVSFDNDGHCTVKVPRLINGAQTITSLARFYEDNNDHPTLKLNNSAVLESIRVLAKIVVDDPFSDFVTNVTICNNRQNPVKAWNLRANDRIQCDLHDRLKGELGIFYSRAEKSFENYSTDVLEDMGYDSSKNIRICPLAQTFLALQGEIGRMSQLPEVFENQKWYEETFKDGYLQCDARKIVVCYKVHMCLRGSMQRLEERAGRQIVTAIGRARNLVWALLIQGILNVDNLSDLLDEYGKTLVKEFPFQECLRGLATQRLLPILRELLANNDYEEKVENEKYDFLRTKEVFKRCMDIAHDKYGWNKKFF